jgi:hypothetical protein
LYSIKIGEEFLFSLASIKLNNNNLAATEQYLALEKRATLSVA